MYLRTVRVVLNEGKYGEYWAWAKDIVDLWDDANVIRAGGPYQAADPEGQHVALWVTVHNTEEECAELFRELYATPQGTALIAKRPPLVKETTTAAFHEWDRSQPAPPVPDLS